MARHNKFWKCFWVLLLFAVVFGTVFLGKRTLDLVADKTIYKNDMFTLRDVVIHGNGLLTDEQVLSLLDLDIGNTNIMSLNLQAIKYRLETNSVIESAFVERFLLDDKLYVTVNARTPFVCCEVIYDDVGNFWKIYLDETGHIMVPNDLFWSAMQSVSDGLPILKGIPLSELGTADGWKKECKYEGALNAIKFLQLYKKSFLYEKEDILEIDVSDSRFCVFKTTGGIEATFDGETVERAFAYFQSIYQYSLTNNHKIKSVNLSVENNVPVKWVQTNIVSATVNKKRK